MNISFCTVVLSLIQGIALNTGVLPLAKGGALQFPSSAGCREELLDPPDLGSTTAADRDVFLEN
jgi:hypothetical protein